MIKGAFTSQVNAANEVYLYLTDVLLYFRFPSLTYSSTIHLHQQPSTITIYYLLQSHTTSTNLVNLPVTIYKMVKWDQDQKFKLLLVIIQHLNPGSLPWDDIASTMGPEFSSEAAR